MPRNEGQSLLDEFRASGKGKEPEALQEPDAVGFPLFFLQGRAGEKVANKTATAQEIHTKLIKRWYELSSDEQNLWNKGAQQQNQAAKSGKEAVYSCVGGCGFEGEFSVVEAHEQVCEYVFGDQLESDIDSENSESGRKELKCIECIKELENSE